LNSNRIRYDLKLNKFLQVSYVLYAQPDTKADIIVQRITKDELEIFAVTKQTIIYFYLSFVSSKRLQNYSNSNV